MIAECNVVCGSWGQGLVAGDRLFAMLPWILVLFIAAILILGAVRK